MPIPRIEAVIEVSRERQTAAGYVHRKFSIKADLTERIFTLPPEKVRRLRDDCDLLKSICQEIVGDKGKVDGVMVCDAIKRSIGVCRVGDITPSDLLAARIMSGVIRKRQRPIMAPLVGEPA